MLEVEKKALNKQLRDILNNMNDEGKSASFDIIKFFYDENLTYDEIMYAIGYFYTDCKSAKKRIEF